MNSDKYIQDTIEENRSLREDNKALVERNDTLEKTIHCLQDKIKEMLSGLKD